MVFLRRIHIRGFTSLKDLAFDIPSGLMALIGQNDTGKSNILDAFGFISAIVSMPLPAALDRYGGIASCAWRGKGDEGIQVTLYGDFGNSRKGFRYDFHVTQKGGLPPEFISERLSIDSGPSILRPPNENRFKLTRDKEGSKKSLNHAVTPFFKERSLLFAITEAELKTKQQDPAIDALLCDSSYELQRTLAEMRVYRPTRKALSAPSSVQLHASLQADGSGLAGVVDALVTDPEYRDAFQRIRETLLTIVPSIKEVGTRVVNFPPPNQSELGKVVKFIADFNGERFSFDADRASNGLLLILAYLILSEGPKRSPVLLLDEPENGVHMARLKEIVDALKRAVERSKTPVILSTHSPYFLDHLEPEEVFIVTRADNGETRMTPMASFPKLDVWRKGFNLGELWSNLGEEKLTESA